MPTINQTGNNPAGGFTNPAFAELYDGLTARLPHWTFWAILATYLITAALNAWAIPMPLFLSIPVAVMIQVGRFLTVFTPFLNPNGRTSHLPRIIALGATGFALSEYAFSLAHLEKTGATFWALFLFGGMVIVFGCILELQFIAEGERAFGLSTNRKNQPGALSILNTAQQQAYEQQQQNAALRAEVEFLKNQYAQQSAYPTPSPQGNGPAPRRTTSPNPALTNQGHNGSNPTGNGAATLNHHNGV